MSKAIDPFEEFLRKKKVKMLEEKFRRERAAEEDAAVDEEEDARLREEMDDFFESGQNAGAELFSKRVGVFGIIFGILAILTGFFGMNFSAIADPYQWCSQNWLFWSVIAVILAGIAFGFGYFVYSKFRNKKNK